jgi:alpha-D-ribose 1-methylphosphonate 5-triphosphate synthase subunit PhnI
MPTSPGSGKSRELLGLCVGFLETEGPLSTRELAALAIKASDMDTQDDMLAKIMTNKSSTSCGRRRSGW